MENSEYRKRKFNSSKHSTKDVDVTFKCGSDYLIGDFKMSNIGNSLTYKCDRYTKKKFVSTKDLNLRI